MALVCECLALSGHEVEPIDVSAPVARTIARLEAFNPDLVFNTARVFYPALIEELKIPLVGSPASLIAMLTSQGLIDKLSNLQRANPNLRGEGYPRGERFTAAFFEKPGPSDEAASRLQVGIADAHQQKSSLLPDLIDSTNKIVEALGLRDLGTINFELNQDGKISFCGADANPSLDANSVFWSALKMAGHSDPSAVLSAVIENAARRYGLSSNTSKRNLSGRRKVCVGFAFNLRRIHSSVENDIDAEAEFDSPETVGAVREAISSLGYDVVDLEANPDLPAILPKSKIDVVFNIAEGIGGRARESLVPALLDLMQIPYTGSDVTSISICHDKILAKRVVAQAGISTSPYFTLVSGREKIPKSAQFPLIIKPAYEGSSKGIHDSSVVMNEAQLRAQALQYLSRYHQPLLVEGYLPGREFTIGLLGEKRPQVLPIMEVIFTDKNNAFPVYSFESKVNDVKVKFEVPAKIDSQLNKKLSTMARQVFAALGCRDYARMDFRLDEKGNPFFLECNPLPGLTPNFSDLVVLAAAAGFDYRMLIAEMLAPALRRMRVQQSL